MTNSHGDPGWGLRVIGWVSGLLACLWGCRGNRSCALEVSALLSDYRIGNYRKQDMMFELSRTTVFSSCLHRGWFQLLKTFSTEEQPHPTPCSLSDIIITIRQRTSDIWPRSAWEEGVVRWKAKLAFRGTSERSWSICPDFPSKHGCFSAAPLKLS